MVLDSSRLPGACDCTETSFKRTDLIVLIVKMQLHSGKEPFETLSLFCHLSIVFLTKDVIMLYQGLLG